MPRRCGRSFGRGDVVAELRLRGLTPVRQAKRAAMAGAGTGWRGVARAAARGAAVRQVAAALVVVPVLLGAMAATAQSPAAPQVAVAGLPFLPPDDPAAVGALLS